MSQTCFFRLSLLHLDRDALHKPDFTLFLQTDTLNSYWMWWNVIKNYFCATVEEMYDEGHPHDFVRNTNSPEKKWPEFEKSGYRIWVMKALKSNESDLTCVDFTPNETINLDTITKVEKGDFDSILYRILHAFLFKHMK